MTSSPAPRKPLPPPTGSPPEALPSRRPGAALTLTARGVCFAFGATAPSRFARQHPSYLRSINVAQGLESEHPSRRVYWPWWPRRSRRAEPTDDLVMAPASVLENVSIDLPPGQVTVILGPNGSGKSTLLHTLLGYLRPYRGEVLLNRQPLREFSAVELAEAMAFVSQTPSVAFAFTVEEIVAMGRWPHRRDGERRRREWLGGHGSPSDRAAVDQALDLTHVRHLTGRTFAELSGGERQRVIIARALAQDAPILLLDEPTAALDLWHQLELLHLLRDLAHRRGRTVGWVAHELNLARRFCDQAVLMNQGRVVAAGAPGQVLTPETLEPVYQVRVTVNGGQLAFTRRSEGVPAGMPPLTES